MSVVVEGIENNEQLELISADGAVTEAQGYLSTPRMVAACRTIRSSRLHRDNRLEQAQLLQPWVLLARKINPNVSKALQFC
jgi:hypothetical protein